MYSLQNRKKTAEETKSSLLTSGYERLITMEICCLQNVIQKTKVHFEILT